MNALPLFLLIALLAMFAGIALIRRGRRGRAIDDHPVCRRCGFDLVGLPEDSHRCSECGADLRVRRAIVRGRHVPRTGSLIGGGLLVLTSAFMLFLPTTIEFRRNGLTPYKPIWLLIREARSSNALTSNVALRELLRRTENPKLGDGSWREIADAGLDVQANPTSAWHQEWGDLIERARARHALDDERWQRYLRQGIRATLQVRTKVRRGDAVPYRIDYDCRFATNGVQAMLVHETAIDAAPRTPDSSMSNIIRTSWPGSWPGNYDPGRAPGQQSAQSQLGLHTLNVLMHVQVYGTARSPEAHHDMDLPARFELVSEDEALVAPIEDATASLERSLSITPQLRHPKSADMNRLSDLTVGPRRFPIAFDVYVNDGTGERRLRSLALAAGQSFTTFGFFLPEDLRGTDVDLILRPSPDAARQTVDQTQYWNGVIEIRDVPIQGNP